MLLMCGVQLESDGHRCTSIHGDLDHEARDRVVSEFRSGTTKILIATDVLSRGFDVTQVSSTALLASADFRSERTCVGIPRLAPFQRYQLNRYAPRFYRAREQWKAPESLSCNSGRDQMPEQNPSS